MSTMLNARTPLRSSSSHAAVPPAPFGGSLVAGVDRAPMRYADAPTAAVDVVVGAPIERLWPLVTDINLPARFSSEFRGAEWLDDGPAVGARFRGRSEH